MKKEYNINLLFDSYCLSDFVVKNRLEENMEQQLKTTRDKKGWLIPYLLGLDNMFFKRWDYWTRICLSDRIPSEPIPNIRFQPSYHYQQKQVYKNIRKCLDFAAHISNPLEQFIDWLLWGFNRGDFPNITDKIEDYWYRTFNLGLFYKEPADHWGEIASEYLGRNNSLGFFSTPGNVVDMMVSMNFGGVPKHKHKRLSVCDPCCGTGIILLYASNYSLNLYGMDISCLLTKIAQINAFVYVPWMAYRPMNLNIFDEIEQEAITEIELPSGIKIPHCNNCNSDTPTFLLELQTEHELIVNNGLISIGKPNISRDLIAKRLKPENITCAKCFKQFEKEGL